MTVGRCLECTERIGTGGRMGGFVLPQSVGKRAAPFVTSLRCQPPCPAGRMG